MTTPPTAPSAVSTPDGPPVSIAHPAVPVGSPTSPGRGPGGRLPNGELRRLVAAFLAERSGVVFTPFEVARGLGRSSGAVGNALARLAARGEAVQTTTRPVRYRASATTAAAASAVTSSGSARRTRTPRPTTSSAVPPAATSPAPAPPAPAPPAPAARTRRTGARAASPCKRRPHALPPTTSERAQRRPPRRP